MSREVFLLKVDDREMWEYGNTVSVLKNGDFFKVRDFIRNGDYENGVHGNFIVLHSHPHGVEQLSQDDIDTLTGWRFGLDRDFIAGIVLQRTLKLYDVVLANKKVSIIEQGFWDVMISYVLFGLRNSLKEIRKRSQYE